MTREEIDELKGLAASMGLYDDKNPCKRAVILGKAIKALEQEPKSGMWIEHFDESGKWYECDQCHTDWGDPVNYCPNCGTKMEVSE